AYAQAPKEIEIGVVAGKSKDEIIFQPNFAVGSTKHDAIGTNLENTGAEIGLDLSILYTIFDIRLNPILYVLMHRWTTMYQCDARAAAPYLQGDNGCRLLPAADPESAVDIRRGL